MACQYRGARYGQPNPLGWARDEGPSSQDQESLPYLRHSDLGRPGFCSDACRKVAYRARKAGDPQALFDRWQALLPRIAPLRRALAEYQAIERALSANGLNPHKIVERRRRKARETK